MAIENTIRASPGTEPLPSTRASRYEKTLPDGRSILRLLEVTNNTIMAGKLYQIELVNGNITIPFPRYCERYTEMDIKKIYASIRSRADVEKFMKEEEQRYRVK